MYIIQVYRDEETMVEINLIEINYTNIKIQYSYTGKTMGGKFWILYLCREYYKHKKNAGHISKIGNVR